MQPQLESTAGAASAEFDAVEADIADADAAEQVQLPVADAAEAANEVEPVAATGVQVDPVPAPVADAAAQAEQPTAAAAPADTGGNGAVRGLFDPMPDAPAKIADPAEAAANAVAREEDAEDDGHPAAAGEHKA